MHTDKVATIYWLGNDLMWIKMAIARDFDDETIGHTIEKAIDYMSDLEVDQSYIDLLKAGWEFYKTYKVGLSNTINQIKWYMNDELSKVEKGFHKR